MSKSDMDEHTVFLDEGDFIGAYDAETDTRVGPVAPPTPDAAPTHTTSFVHYRSIILRRGDAA